MRPKQDPRSGARSDAAGKRQRRGKGHWSCVGQTIEVNWNNIGIDIVTLSDDGRKGLVVVKNNPTKQYIIRRLK